MKKFTIPMALAVATLLASVPWQSKAQNEPCFTDFDVFLEPTFGDSTEGFAAEFVSWGTFYGEPETWDMGDGTILTENDLWGADWFYHFYDEAGNYTVTHTVEQWDGSTCSHSVEVEVSENGFQFIYEYTDEEYELINEYYNNSYDTTFSMEDLSEEFLTYYDTCYIDFFDYAEDLNNGLAVTFESYTANENMDFVWDFGDGNTGSGDITSHTYAEAGTYAVSLAGSDMDGCQEVVTWDVYVYDGSEFLDDYDSSGSWYGDCDFSSIYGWVGSSEWSDIVSATITLYAFEDGEMIPVEEIFSEVGFFSFDDLDDGMYAVYAQTDEYISGYFSSTESSDWAFENPDIDLTHVALNWEDAGIITVVDGEGGYIGIDLVGEALLSGDGEINGEITFDNEDGGKQELPVAGATVLLLDQNGSPLASSITDENGYYEFTNLPYAEYKIWTEVWGHNTQPVDVEVSEQQKVVKDIDVVVKDAQIVGALNVKQIHNIKNVSEIYPNPAIQNITLSVETKKAMDVKLSITNMVGQTVFNASKNLRAGLNTVWIDITDLRVGNYQVELVNRQGKVISTQQLSKVE